MDKKVKLHVLYNVSKGKEFTLQSSYDFENWATKHTFTANETSHEIIEKINNQKAELVYNEIDQNPLFSGTAEVEDRSTMNATFRLNNEELNEEFMSMLSDANISGLKGHRSVGGFRASMYNAMPLESVKTLVDVMQELTNKKG